MSDHRKDLYKGEVEILPPEDEQPAFGRVFYSSGRGTVRVFKLGPFSGAALALATALMMAFGFLFLSGMLMLLVPLVLFGGVGAYLASRFGGFGRLPR